MNPQKTFLNERKRISRTLSKSREIQSLSKKLIALLTTEKYNYTFDWLGRPIIQLPEDIVAIQEIIWRTKPDLIIEAGIAHGGSLILSASILEQIGSGSVLGIDVDIRKHNRKEIERHPLSRRIRMIEGSSVDPKTIERVRAIARNKKRIMVILDSNHSHDHVLKELNAYAPLVTKDCYLVVFDTIVEFMPKGTVKNKPWDKGSNPATALKAYLKKNKNLVVDRSVQDKLIFTCAAEGYVKRIR